MITVEYIDHMGTDLSVVNAARVSFAKESDWADKGMFYRDDGVPDGFVEIGGTDDDLGICGRLSDADTRLIRFLARERHELPFAHTAVTLRVKAPIPQRTQCFKSKIGFVENEESRRYISTEPELFIPEFREAAKDKKQGSGDVHPHAEFWGEQYEAIANLSLGTYSNMIAGGVCPEQARYILPQGVMVNWIWTGSLLAYARFCKLRLKSDTQKETRDLACKVDEIMVGLYPVSWTSLMEGSK